jgi:hypothetical protein
VWGVWGCGLGGVGVWGVWGVWGCGGVGVWGVAGLGGVGCCRVGSLLTFDIPQTALVATLDTYDFYSTRRFHVFFFNKMGCPALGVAFFETACTAW